MNKLIQVLLLKLVVVVSTNAQPNYPAPTGVYCSCGPTTGQGNGSVDPAIAALPFVKGILVRVAWEKCEPSDNVYNWTLIDGQITAAKNYGKKISLAIGCGGGIPQWVFQQGAQRLIPTSPPINDTIAVPWDTIFINRWKDFIQQLGAKYKNDTTIRLVYITNASLNGFEMQLPFTSNPPLTTAGYSDAKMIASWDTAVHTFAQAFPNHYLTNDFHPVNSSDAVGNSIYAYATATIGNRYGANAWWWTQHNTTVYPAQYTILQSAASTQSFSGVQMAYSGTSDSASFGAGGMPAALQLARSNGVCYWEIWNQDLLNGNFTNLLTNATCTTTSIHETADKNAVLKVFPNPANNMLNVTWSAQKTIGDVIIYDLTGRSVKTYNSVHNNASIPIDDLTNGVYLLRVVSGDRENATTRFTIER